MTLPLTLASAALIHERDTPLNRSPRHRERELCRMDTAPMDEPRGEPWWQSAVVVIGLPAFVIGLWALLEAIS